MTEGEKLLIDDLNEFVRQSADILDEQQSTGIRPPPVIEITEQSLATTRFGLELSPEPVAQTGPEQPICGGGGACCHGTFPALVCSEVGSEAECDALGGNFFPGRTCDEINCEVGACCHFDGTCAEVEDFLCDSETVYFNGYGTTCAGTRCEGRCDICKLCGGEHFTCNCVGTPYDCGQQCFNNLTLEECNEYILFGYAVRWLGEWNTDGACGEGEDCFIFEGACAFGIGACCWAEGCFDNASIEDCNSVSGTFHDGCTCGEIEC